MMVRMITLMAGPEGVVQPGTVLDLGPPEAQRLIEGGYAVAALFMSCVGAW